MSKKEMLGFDDAEKISFEITSKMFNYFLTQMKKLTQQQMLELKITPDIFSSIISQSAVNFFVTAMKWNDKMLKDVYGINIDKPTVIDMCELIMKNAKNIKHFDVNKH